MQSLSMGRRNDRGYNSDMDGSSRPVRGSMRGRGGRGGRGGLGRQNDRYNSGSTNSDYVNNVDRRKPIGNGRGRGHTSNGRPPRGGGGGDRNNRDRPTSNRGGRLLSVDDSVGGGDCERK